MHVKPREAAKETKMWRDNEREAAFAFWSDMEVETTDGDGGEPVKARICAGVVIGAHGVRLVAEGTRRATYQAALTNEQERALYEALRARFDTEHRAALEQSALAKLSPLEQEVLRARWGKASETTTKGPVKAKKRSDR